MSEFIGFPSTVNDKVLDETTMTIGQGGYVEDKNSEGTFTQRRLTSLSCPDKYNVVMYFDWEEKDANGLSEFDRFINWYKFDHKRGVNPFQFKSLSKFGVNGTEETSHYKITGNLSIQKSGLAYKVSMEWTEVPTEAILITEDSVDVDHILSYPNDTQKAVYVIYTGTRSTVPLTTQYKFLIDGTHEVPVKVIPSYSSSDTYRFIFSGAWTKGNHEIKLYEGSTLKSQFSMVVY